MKRKLLKKALIVAVLAYLLAPVSLSADLDGIFTVQSEAVKAAELENALSGGAAELLGGLKITDSLDASGALGGLVNAALQKLGGIVKAGLRDAALIVLIAVFCSVVTASLGAGSDNYVVLAGVLAIAAVCVTGANSFIGLGRTTLDELDAFSKLLLPTLASASASSGALTSAAAKYAATMLFINIMVTLSKTVIMPLIYAYLAVSIADAAIGNGGLAAAGALIKWLARSALIIVTLAFIAYLSITGVITGSSDAVAIRAAKTTIATVLPVVGGIVADASDTVLAGASLLRNAVGVFGLLAVLAFCAVPFMRLGVSYLLLKASGGLADAIADKRIGALINAVSSAFGLTLGMTGSVAVMLYVSIISFLKAVV